MTNDTTPRPKPAAPKKAPVPTQETVNKPATATEKPKFVRKPHLTERPFRAHEGLLALQKQLEQGKKKSSRKPVRRATKEKN